MNLILSFRRLAVLACLLLTAMVHAVPPGAPPFQMGDRICFIGDSITHSGSYHSMVYLFYATRFPDRPFTIYNCGSSGDVAPGALRRFEWDIMSNKPTAATIMLGMNDVGGDYGKDKPPAQVAKHRDGALATYRKTMSELAERLQQAGVRLIFLTPSIYDQTATLPAPNQFGKNDALGQCATFVSEMAATRHAGLADFFQPMSAINAAEQKKNPAFTIVGNDRIHPREPGHFVMAYALLKAQGMPRFVARMTLDTMTSKVTTAECCVIEGLAVKSGEVAFTATERALPFPVPAAAQQALEYVPFMDELNQEILCVKGLEPGIYDLLIDGIAVGQYSAQALGDGVNLAANTATPMMRQALAVARINEKRHGIARDLRSVAYVRHTMIMPGKVNEGDQAAIKKFFAEASERSKGKSWDGYRQYCINQYLKFTPHEAAMRQELEQLMREMYTANKPAPHRFVIRKKH